MIKAIAVYIITLIALGILSYAKGTDAATCGFNIFAIIGGCGLMLAIIIKEFD